MLLNSNPATIMTDPETANRTYVGPMTPELVEEIKIMKYMKILENRRKSSISTSRKSAKIRVGTP